MATFELDPADVRRAVEMQHLYPEFLEALETQLDAAEDTLPAWLWYRFSASTHPKGDGGAAWRALDFATQCFWMHEAEAVRRAVKRGGFKDRR